MRPRRLTYVLAGVAPALLVGLIGACSGSGSTEAPSSSVFSAVGLDASPAIDADAVLDAATGVPDASIGELDASTGVPDASTGVPDASTGVPDASTGEPDASTGVPDASTGEPDASTGEPDASAGEPDASTGEPDASAGEDAGAPATGGGGGGGSGVDAGSVATTPSSPTPAPTLSSGIGNLSVGGAPANEDCSFHASPRSAGGAVYVGLLLAVIALRRRRRVSSA